jgi:hypothetical protein
MITLKFFLKKYLSLIVSLLIFWAATSILTYISLGQTDGRFIYTLDDPYIHMAIAKNFVNSGTWGVTKYEFTSCSSSPLWPFLISIFYFIFGVKVITPFILNIVFASLTAVVVFKFIIRFIKNSIAIAIVLLSVLFFGPFISVMFTGLEHSLYAMLLVMTAIYLYKTFDEENKKSIYILFILVILLTSTRYEGMFVTASLFLIFLYRKKFLAALLIVAFAFIPFLIMGIVSVLHGWSFFPNSILLKSPVPLSDFWSFINSVFSPRFLRLFWVYKRIMVLIVISCIIFLTFRKDKDKFALKSLIFLFVSVAFLHVQFAVIGSLLRYELYIIVLGIFIDSVLIVKFLQVKKRYVKISFAIFLVLLVFLFTQSTYRAVKNVPAAVTNIYQMQYQMAQFIGKYYDEKSIALNDIGAVNYYCNINCVDIWGLASKEVMSYKKKNVYDLDIIYNFNREKNTEIAIVFDSWFLEYGGLPSKWIETGKWTIPDNVTCGADSVTFYATDSSNYIKLTKNLQLFSKELPTQVIQKGY